MQRLGLPPQLLLGPVAAMACVVATARGLRRRRVLGRFALIPGLGALLPRPLLPRKDERIDGVESRRKRHLARLDRRYARTGGLDRLPQPLHGGEQRVERGPNVGVALGGGPIPGLGGRHLLP